MIFISSLAFKSDKIKDSVINLVKMGFRNIELTGGTKPYKGMISDLIALKRDYNLNFIVHAPFPPYDDFEYFLNLASTNDKIYNRTIEHYKSAIDIVNAVGMNKFAVHAGYYIDHKVSEFGQKKIGRMSKKKSIERFCSGFNKIRNIAGNIELYIENNPYNAKSKNEKRNFMMTTYDEYLDLRRMIDFKPMVDLAHLGTACKSFGLNFKKEADKFLAKTDYIHLSKCRGKQDRHEGFDSRKDLQKFLGGIDISNKIITLETWNGDIRKSYMATKRSI